MCNYHMNLLCGKSIYFEITFLQSVFISLLRGGNRGDSSSFCLLLGQYCFLKNPKIKAAPKEEGAVYLNNRPIQKNRRVSSD